MNALLVDSLVEVVLNLPPGEQELFQSRLHDRQMETTTLEQLTSAEKSEQFRQWLARFPKSNISLPAESRCRENIDRA